jgi:hypothetical protein
MYTHQNNQRDVSVKIGSKDVVVAVVGPDEAAGAAAVARTTIAACRVETVRLLMATLSTEEIAKVKAGDKGRLLFDF